MVRDQESLLPPHEDSATIPVTHRQKGLLQIILDMSESWETRPMDHVLLLIGAPVLCQESVSTADDFSVEIRCELRPVIC